MAPRTPPVQETSTKWILGLLALIFIPVIILVVLLFMFFAAIAGTQDFSETGNVAVIPIHGEIMSERGSGFSFDGTASPDILKLIKKASEDDSVRAIMLDINSPGGSAVASAEIAQAIQQLEKPNYAVIRELGASGAFWIAESTDLVFAHPLSITGSVGVVGSYLEFAGILESYNVTYRQLIAGDFKDAGSPFKKMTVKEQERFQKLLDDLHEAFIVEVASYRNLPVEQVREHADGFVFLGKDAKNMGFVDELGTQDDARRYIENKLNITAELVVYRSTPSFLELFSGVSAEQFYAIGRGIGDSFSRVESAIPMAKY